MYTSDNEWDYVGYYNIYNIEILFMSKCMYVCMKVIYSLIAVNDNM